MRVLPASLLRWCWISLMLLVAPGRMAAQLTLRSIPYENGTRTWYEHVPASYDGSKAVPLVVALHGAYDYGAAFAPRSGWSDVADANNFIVIYPNGEGNNNVFVWHSWTFDGSKPDDIGFLLAVIGQVEATYKIDPTRVYMTGFSNGGGMTSFFTAYHADLLAAIAPLSAGWVTNTGNSDSILKPDAVTPAWVWRGTKDPTSNTPSVFVQDEQQTAFWVKLDGDGSTPQVSTLGNDTTSVYTGGEAEVRFTSVLGLGHDVEAGSAARIWKEFFSRFSRVNGAIHTIGPPKVKIGVIKRKAVSARGINGVLTVSREGDAASDLTVGYEISGSAVSGVNFRPLPGTATLLAGASSRHVKVHPLPVEATAGKKSVHLTLLPSDDYTLEEPIVATVKIVPGL